MKREEVLSQIPKHCIVRLPVRFGKTKVAIDKIEEENPSSVLWVTPSRKLADEDIAAEFRKWGKDDLLKKVKTTTYASLSKETGKYDKIILDELQCITEANTKNLINKTLKYKSILAMTGTLPDNKEKQQIIKELNLEIAVNIDDSEAVDSEIISDFNIIVLYCKLNKVDKDIETGGKTKRFFVTEAAHYKYLSDRITKFMQENKGKPVPKFLSLDRMQFIHNLKSKNEKAKMLLENLSGRTLCFAANTTQADFICENSYHSKTNDKNLQAFLNNEIDKLSLVNSGGTGYTYKNLQNVIITQCDSNKLGNTSQKAGRVLLKEVDKVATIFVICCEDTVDKRWVNSFLENYDKSKIKHYKFDDYINSLCFDNELNEYTPDEEEKPKTFYQDSYYLNQVAEFQRLFNQPILEKPQIPDLSRAKLRVSLIQEELNELKEAIETDNIVEVLDALGDLQYVLSGSVLEFGMGEVFKEAFEDIHRSNMSKACSTYNEALETQEYYKKEKNTDSIIIKKDDKFLVQRKDDNKQLKSIKYQAVQLKKYVK